MFPEVHETTVEGIPAFWADLPGPLTGTLLFGVGMRDEPVHLAGITHLIEHLAFCPLEPLLIDHNAMVDDESLEIPRHGRAERCPGRARTSSPPPHTMPQTAVSTPRAVESGKSGVAVSLIIDGKIAPPLGAALSQEVDTRLRHELALIYAIDVFHTHVDSDAIQLDVVLDPVEDDIARTVGAVLTLLHQIAADGFGQDVLKRARSSIATDHAWTNATAAQHLERLARAETVSEY